MQVTPRNHLALTRAFATNATRYWIEVFPYVGSEIGRWEALAANISDPLLSRLALLATRTDRTNLEGAAAFAVLCPRRWRGPVVKALVTFQALYDYADMLAEQPSFDMFANGRQLHLSLLAALDPSIDDADYYLYNGREEDGEYLQRMIAACRGACAQLPSYAAARNSALRLVRRIVDYQSLSHCHEHPGHERALASWAREIVPEDEKLHWWEAAAAGGSSLGVFALIAAAAHPGHTEREMLAIEQAYFPWIGALPVLLDSLADRDNDLACGHHSLVAHYASPQEAAARLGEITARAVGAARELPQAVGHLALLSAASSFYLSSPGAHGTDAALVRRAVLAQLGPLAKPAMALLRVRRTALDALSTLTCPLRRGEVYG